MTVLMKIQEFIQAYAQAISSILESEVTVVDSELVRVTGTGAYAVRTGYRVSHGTFLNQVLQTGNSGMITNVKEDSNCKDCDHRETCKELASLAYPIFEDSKVVGVISIIAFREEQRNKFIQNQGQLEEFLKYMSILLESKLYTDKAKDRLEQQLKVVYGSKQGWEFIGNSKKMKDAILMGQKVATTNSTVFIRGESGTGKEIMAKMIHDCSSRRDKLMISINCAAIPETLVESELFGYEEGSFTGARKKGAIGKFELADKSTIFLDEIGDIPLHVQTKLLRVLQENKVEKIGSTTPIAIDIRVICATNKNIEQMIKEGTFREDLYYRLNIIPIELAPLRRRKEDIEPLIYHYINFYNQRLNKAITGIAPEALQTMIGYDWPGNVREVRNIMEYLANIVETGMVELCDLPDNIVLRSEKAYEDWSLEKIMEEYEKKVLTSMMRNTKITEEKENLANTLQVSRATLYRKLKKYDLL